MFEGFETVYSYTRKQAIEDGVLIDVTDTAKEAGVKAPTAITAELHGIIERIPDGFEYQSYGGRLWDVLNMFRYAALQNGHMNEIEFSLALTTQRNQNIPDELQRRVKLKAHIGPGDNGEPVITIMMPWED